MRLLAITESASGANDAIVRGNSGTTCRVALLIRPIRTRSIAGVYLMNFQTVEHPARHDQALLR